MNKLKKSVYFCSNTDECQSLMDILKSFNAPISEEQAWALIYQSVSLYRDYVKLNVYNIKHICIPRKTSNLNVHRDGSVHINVDNNEHTECLAPSQKKILFGIGVVIYRALDYNMPSDIESPISQELEEVINCMTIEDRDDDEGIENDSEDVDDDTFVRTKELDHVLDMCISRVLPSTADHYKAVCRALAMESIELKLFISKVFRGDAESLRIKAEAQSSRQELEKLGFSDWARFWMQVVEELRQGVRLRKSHWSRTSAEFELTPYEILMEDIRTRKYHLRKVMINGDVPQRVTKDAHAVILEFIRSRPPLKKASERKLQPLENNKTPREQLLESIRQGSVLKPIVNHRLLPTQDCSQKSSGVHESPLPSRQRLIKVDLSLLEDDDQLIVDIVTDEILDITKANCHQLPKTNNENNQNNLNRIIRRPAHELASECESRYASMRRHTIVGCHSSNISINECTSLPTEDSRASSAEPSDSSCALEKKQWKETINGNDRLSLTLEEIVHIRSVMTKAELEALPVGIQVKEDVERKKVCFLCLRTRFSIFGPWGIQCKLCRRTVCTKCYSKMRIPTEHFRNVPVVLLSPSLMNSPVGSQAPSPSHSAHHTGTSNIGGFDENFPRSLMERLMRPELDRKVKVRNSVGSAPSSPKHQRSALSTPGAGAHIENGTISSLVLANGTSNGTLDSKGLTSNGSRNSLMSRSMEGPRSLPPQSPARPHSNNSTLDRRNRLANLCALPAPTNSEQKEMLRGELMAVCNDCRGLVLEIIRSSRQTRSTARNQAIRNLTLDLSPVYK